MISTDDDVDLIGQLDKKAIFYEEVLQLYPLDGSKKTCNEISSEIFTDSHVIWYSSLYTFVMRNDTEHDF